MFRVTIRFYEELNELLPRQFRKTDSCAEISPGTTTKALIEHYGVPHPEVDLVLVNGVSVDFSFQLRDGDRMSVYPVFESFDLTGVSRVRPVPLRQTRFMIDVNLGRLVGRLRMLGFDARHSNGLSDQEITEIAARELRIILTRDRQLLTRKNVSRGYYVRATDPDDQILEVVQRFDLRAAIRPFIRCITCNDPLQRVAKDQVLDRLPPLVRERQQAFSYCAACDRVYWQGTHWERMRRKIDGILR